MIAHGPPACDSLAFRTFRLLGIYRGSTILLLQSFPLFFSLVFYNTLWSLNSVLGPVHRSRRHSKHSTAQHPGRTRQVDTDRKRKLRPALMVLPFLPPQFFHTTQTAQPLPHPDRAQSWSRGLRKEFLLKTGISYFRKPREQVARLFSPPSP